MEDRTVPPATNNEHLQDDQTGKGLTSYLRKIPSKVNSFVRFLASLPSKGCYFNSWGIYHDDGQFKEFIEEIHENEIKDETVDETWKRLRSGRTIAVSLCPADKIAETLLYIARMNGTAVTGWSIKQQSYFDRKSESWVNSTYYAGKKKCTVIATLDMKQEDKFNLVGKTVIPPNAYGMKNQKNQVNILPLLGSWHEEVKPNQSLFYLASLPKNISLHDHMFRVSEIIWGGTHEEIEKNRVTISVEKFNVADQEQLSELKKKYNINKKKWGNKVLQDGWLQPNASNGPTEEDLTLFANEKKDLPRVPVIRVSTSNYKLGRKILSELTKDAHFEIYHGLEASICRDLDTAQKLQKHQDEVFENSITDKNGKLVVIFNSREMIKDFNLQVYVGTDGIVSARFPRNREVNLNKGEKAIELKIADDRHSEIVQRLNAKKGGYLLGMPETKIKTFYVPSEFNKCYSERSFMSSNPSSAAPHEQREQQEAATTEKCFLEEMEKKGHGGLVLQNFAKIYTCASRNNYTNLPFSETIANDIKEAYETALAVGLQDPEMTHSVPHQDSMGPNEDLAKALERIKELENTVNDLSPRPITENPDLHEANKKIVDLQNEVSSLNKQLAALTTTLTTTIQSLTTHSSLQPIGRPKKRNQTPKNATPRTKGMDQFSALASDDSSLTQLEQMEEEPETENLNGKRPTGTGSPQKTTGDDSIQPPPSSRPRGSDDEL